MKMGKRVIEFSKNQFIGVITFSCEGPAEDIYSRLAVELKEICEEINFDHAVRVVVITGTGRKFFYDVSDLNIKKEKPLDCRDLLSIASSVAALNCPTIAAINGDAIGQGLELALACDIRVGVEGFYFGIPYISQGLIPRDGATQRLQRIVGISKAMEMILLAEPIDAKEALRIGLVNKLVAKDELIPTVMDIASSMCVRSPLALNTAKEAINKGIDLTLEQGLRLEADLYFLLHTTNDRTEGIKAFQEKRKPKFTGS
jgi:enoyl-CoA hydratase/carnithine racemase